MNNYFATLFNDQKTSDFVIVSDNRVGSERKIYVHKLILSVCPYFKTYFETGLSTNKIQYLVSSHCFDTVYQIIQYIYCRDLSNVTPDNVMDVVNLADEWLILEDIIPKIFSILLERWYEKFYVNEIDRVCGVMESHKSLHKDIALLIKHHIDDIPAEYMNSHLIKYIQDEKILIRWCFYNKNLKQLNKSKPDITSLYHLICADIHEGKLDHSALSCIPDIEQFTSGQRLCRWVTPDLPETKLIMRTDPKSVNLIISLQPLHIEKTYFIYSLAASGLTDVHFVQSPVRFQPGRYYITTIGYIDIINIQYDDKIVSIAYPNFIYKCRFSRSFLADDTTQLYRITVIKD